MRAKSSQSSALPSHVNDNLAHIAYAPSDSALFTGGRCLVGLTFDAQVHDVVPADGAVINNNIPGP